MLPFYLGRKGENINNLTVIANYIPPKESELLISWVSRLANANGVNKIEDILNSYFFTDSLLANKNAINYLGLVNDLDKNDDLERTFEQYDKLTLYSGLFSMYKSSINFIKLYYSFFQDYKDTHYFGHAILNENNRFKICPECFAKEEYLRVEHNIPGVKVCLKHNCSLYNFVDVNKENIFDINSYEKIVVGDFGLAKRYAEYVNEFVSKKFDINTDDLENLIAGRCEVLAPSKVSKFRNHSFSISEVDKTDGSLRFTKLMEQLMIIYPRISKLEKDINKIHKLELSERELIDMGFTPISSMKNSASIVKHNKCGTEFVSTLRAIKNGIGCPECNNKLSKLEKFEHIVDTYPGYKIDECNKASIEVRHICGNVEKHTVLSILNKGIECNECRKMFKDVYDEKIAEKKLVKKNTDYSNGLFEHLETRTMKNGKKEYVFICKNCGMKLVCKIPRPKTCEGCEKEKKMNEYLKTQSDRFEIISAPVYGDDKARLKCKKCGYEIEPSIDDKTCKKVITQMCPRCAKIDKFAEIDIESLKLKPGELKQDLNKMFEIGEEFSYQDVIKNEKLYQFFESKGGNKLFRAKLKLYQRCGIVEFIGPDRYKLLGDKVINGVKDTIFFKRLVEYAPDEGFALKSILKEKQFQKEDSFRTHKSVKGQLTTLLKENAIRYDGSRYYINEKCK